MHELDSATAKVFRKRLVATMAVTRTADRPTPDRSRRFPALTTYSALTWAGANVVATGTGGSIKKDPFRLEDGVAARQ